MTFFDRPRNNHDANELLECYVHIGTCAHAKTFANSVTIKGVTICDACGLTLTKLVELGRRYRQDPLFFRGYEEEPSR